MHLADRLKDLTAPTGEEDLMQVNYPTPRVALSTRHALYVLIGALLLCAGVGVKYLAHKDPPAAYPAVAVPPLAAATSVATAPPSSAEVVVSVVGAVAHPGLVTLTPGARAAEALAAATPLPESELRGINQAGRLVDGTQIVVPIQGESVPPAAAPVEGENPGGKVSLNTATAAELMALSGVGEKTAAAIIAHRDSIGGFSSIEQLQDVKGIGPAKYAELEKQVQL